MAPVINPAIAVFAPFNAPLNPSTFPVVEFIIPICSLHDWIPVLRLEWEPFNPVNIVENKDVVGLYKLLITLYKPLLPKILTSFLPVFHSLVAPITSPNPTNIFPSVDNPLKDFHIFVKVFLMPPYLKYTSPVNGSISLVNPNHSIILSLISEAFILTLSIPLS